MVEVTNDNASNASKRLARLVAVQALYQAWFEQEPLGDILSRSLEEADTILNGDGGEGELISERPDPVLFSDIVRGVSENKETLEEMIAGSLDQKLSSSRMEILLRAILLAGVFELHRHASVPQGVIISDYVDVARAFFGAKEPGLVNAVLDNLAKKLRS